MFKKINEKINFINHKMDGLYKKIDRLYEDISNDIQSVHIAVQHLPKIESQQKTIESQQRTIEQLTNALQDKYEHGLFVIGEEGKLPMVIRNGNELTNDRVKYVSVDWTFGEVPNITIEQ